MSTADNFMIRGGSCVHNSLLILDPISTEPVQVHMCTSSCESLFASVLLSLGDSVSLELFIISGSYDLSTSSSTQLLDIVPQSGTLCTLSRSWLLCLFPSTARRHFSDDDQMKYCSEGIAECHL